MSEEKKCPICGKPTYLVYGKYPRKDGLCGQCSKKEKNGEIEQCPDCGKWNQAFAHCDCKKKNKTSENKKSELEELTCIICGNPSNGKHFCFECWNKYKNKVLYIKINKCTEFEKLDAEYTSELVCDDGHLVKSKSEVLIDNYLYSKGIQHAYEKPYPIDENKEHDIHPDFYIPFLKDEKDNIVAKDIYIEHFGYGDENKKYKEQKDYKLNIYKRDNLTVICTTEKDINDGCSNTLERKFRFLTLNKIN